jgi:hypothetical protein
MSDGGWRMEDGWRRKVVRKKIDNSGASSLLSVKNAIL